MTYYYGIAGCSFCIQASDPWAATLIENFLRDFHLDREHASSTPDYTIVISSRALPPDLPKGLETFEVAYGHCFIDGQRYYLAIEDSLIVVDADDSLHVWIGNTARARQPLALANLLAYVVEISLRRSGLFQLHGAGLVPAGQETGTLILGASGSGKSTLTLLLASRGWSYMTDDALLLSDVDGVIRARGMRRFFAASETTLLSCSLTSIDEALGGTMLLDPSKRRLEPAVAFPGRFVQSCLPQTLFFTSISGAEESEVIPIGQAETMSRLIRSNPWAGYDSFTARDHLRILNRLSTQCRAYLFRGGLDVLTAPSVTEALLLSLVDDSAKSLAT